jgi:hypothetical protein
MRDLIAGAALLFGSWWASARSAIGGLSAPGEGVLVRFKPDHGPSGPWKPGMPVFFTGDVRQRGRRVFIGVTWTYPHGETGEPMRGHGLIPTDITTNFRPDGSPMD